MILEVSSLGGHWRQGKRTRVRPVGCQTRMLAGELWAVGGPIACFEAQLANIVCYTAIRLC